MSSPTPPSNDPTVEQDVKGNFVAGDQNIAGRDNIISNYLTGLRHLRPHQVDPDKLMPANRFVSPGNNYDRAAQAVRLSFGSTANVRVVVLLAPEEHGRKSAGLRLLAATNVAAGRIFELLPDWDEPDVACLPEERGAGYLLNLRGVTQPLPDAFYSDLLTYASGLRNAGSYMVITATKTIWSQARAGGPHPEILVVEIERPKPDDVVKKYLESDEETQDRSGWIDNKEGVFFDLLPEDCAPGEAARLASIIAKAKSIEDKDALDEYKGWETHLSDWFRGGSEGVETRAVRIAGAYLNKAPGVVILNSADLLLAAPKINLPTPEGGLLARPDVPSRLKPAGMSFDVDTGVASLVHESQGPAILRYLWTQHTQLSQEVLMQWLQDISQGPAKDHLDALASALTQLAETVGITPIFDLAEGWLRNGSKQHLELVGDLVSDLAVHPTLGSRVRAELARWAAGKTEPARQRAVARACSGSFGKKYPSQALTRARYILNSPGSEEALKDATTAVRALASDVDLAPLVTDTVIKWITNAGKPTGTELNVFYEVFSVPSSPDQLEKSPLAVALTQPGDSGDAIRRRLLEGWQHIIEQSADVFHAQRILLDWRQGAEKGLLPPGPIVDIIFTLGCVTGIVNPPVRDVVLEDGPLKEALIAAFLAEFHRTYQATDGPLPVPSGTTLVESNPEGATEADPETQ
ncbi:hypothetical protein [Streptomyces sp. BSE7-9]|uniref:hypothetical protein n=1 Tax=Streptomyces sp. BSE7-9 TaxID=2759948 RepID=UPI0018EE5ACA|nr:hypothetical protein [Streptomyces sp. BSE7-9]MBJ6644589.1 hypothetical protein [Streptomyces sp. BSE7-9]